MEHGHAGGARDGSGAQPAGDTADAHDVRHHEVAGFLLERDMNVAWPIEILADLNRGLQLGGELRVSVEVVVDDRLG